MSKDEVEICPHCGFSMLRGSASCPHCGAQVGYPPWKKAAAWILLILIAYGLVRCHMRLLEGF